MLTLDEVLQYTWKVSAYDEDLAIIPFMRGDVLCYHYNSVPKETNVEWSSNIEYILRVFKDNNYTKKGFNPYYIYCGPQLPPVILKIKQMSKRFEERYAKI